MIVLTYDRPDALRQLLRDLANQRLDGLPMELIVVNNAHHAHIRPSPWTRTGRLLTRFPDVKVFNSNHNWLCRIRYPATALAQYDTIAFIDDDVVLQNEGFLKCMYDAFVSLRPVDILSCWTALWTAWDDTHLKKVRMNFRTPSVSRMTECDYVGPGL